VSALRRVGFNAIYLDPGVSGGSETYLRHLVPAIAALAPALELEIATTRRGAAALRRDGWDDLARIHALPVDVGERVRHLVTEQVRLPDLAHRRRWDVLHSLANLAPVRARVPAVITLLDLLFLQHRTLPRSTTLAMRWTVLPAARRAAALIAISAAARDEMCALAGFDPSDFTVVPLGAGRVAGAAASATGELQLRARLGLGDARVVLCVAAKRPHKNQALLIRALAHLPADVLVALVGHPEGYDAQLRALVKELRLDARVRLVDYVDDADLEGLWRLASCAAFPTLAEGFGLPVVEAMGRGVPVAASDLPVLHEVGGDVPHWFDPHDPASAAAAIGAAMQDASAAVRGPKQSERFSWETTARATLAVYERAAGKRLPVPPRAAV
jgi:glycosyltransferase involved in cell wall biosynthesis